MPFLLRNLTLNPGEDDSALRPLLARKLGIRESEITSLTVVRKGIDARKRGAIKIVFSVEFALRDESRVTPGGDLSLIERPAPLVFPRLPRIDGIVIVGMGPAGLFAALRLAEYGLTATVLERGRDVDQRTRDVSRFWREGTLIPDSNVQFGEGGAGTFSDGKLTTRVKDPNCGWVLKRLVDFGAPAEILYQAKPHIGTDRLRGVVKGIREKLLSDGFRISFDSRLSGIRTREGRVSAVLVNEEDELSCNTLVLAPGHSARDTYRMLHESGVFIEQKPFAVGVRVEHPQELINAIQYGRNPHQSLPPAEYALTYNNEQSGRSAYSFCMCPGGVVVAAASEPGGVVVNGMSGYRRNSPFANSALVATVGARDFADDSPLAGIEFQRLLERRAFEVGDGGYLAPAQNLMAFLGQGRGKVSSS
ncbi:NAD(P)/FAD-dependent oxidoreductase, partial [Geomonas sp.]|uniref:NAD(P)/FAD-dependent oxidoreductase n=1 Tax=Geomonas sp. TaxID=2651584 RepID=UPI002B45F78A